MTCERIEPNPDQNKMIRGLGNWREDITNEKYEKAVKKITIGKIKVTNQTENKTKEKYKTEKRINNKLPAAVQKFARKKKQ